MGKGQRWAKKAEEEEEDDASDEAGSDAGEGDESELEVGDIEAFARDNLRPGEIIMGDKGAEDQSVKTEKRGVLNKPLLLQKLQAIEYKIPEGAKRIPWIDTLAIESDQELPKGLTSKDGNKLENAFMALATEASKEAYRRLRVMKVPCSRPSDFYAEMFRPDSMMYKVRQWASEETRRIGIVENRKSQLAAKRFEKKAKTKKAEARAADKRETLDEITSWRKKSKRDKANADEENLEDILSRNNLDKFGKKQKWKAPEKGAKRSAKDARYGYGGKQSKNKRNDAKSSRDFSQLGGTKGKGKGKSSKDKGGAKGKGKSKGGGGKGKGGGSGGKGGKSDGGGKGKRKGRD